MKRFFLAALLFCGLPSWAQVAPDAVVSTSGNRVSSLTFTLTIGSGVTNGVVAVGIQDNDTGGRTISSVTVGGSAATLLRRDGVSGSHSAIYEFATGSSTGAKSIVVTMSGAVSGDLIAGAESFSVADQTTPLINCVGGSGTTSIPSETVTSATGDLVFDSVHSNTTGTITPGGGQTQRWNVTGPRSSTKGGASTALGAASVAMSWTTGSSTLTSHSACDIKAAAAGTNQNGNVSETLTTSPSVTASLQAVRGISESLTTTPSVTAQLVTSRNVTESNTTADSVTAQTGKLASVGETLTTSDSLGTQLAANGPLTETLTTSPAVAARLDAQRTIAETLTTSASATAVSSAQPAATCNHSLAMLGAGCN